MTNWIDRLNSFKELKEDWDSYNASPPNDLATAHARYFLYYLMENGREPNKLNPSAFGGIGFTFSNGDKNVYVEFGNTGSCYVGFYDGDKPIVDEVDQNDRGFKQLIKQVDNYLL